MAEGEKKGFNWLLGCGIGCGVLFLLGVIAVVGIVFLAKKGYDTFSEEMAPELAAELRSQYDGLKDEGKVPEEHVALFDELVAIGGAEEGSAWGKMLCLTVVVSSLEDGKVTEAEVGVLEDARDLLQENPDIGLFGMRRFFEHRPEMQAEMQRYQTRYPRGGY